MSFEFIFPEGSEDKSGHEYSAFFETPEIGIIGIFVLPEYENELEIVASDICFNSLMPLTYLLHWRI